MCACVRVYVHVVTVVGLMNTRSKKVYMHILPTNMVMTMEDTAIIMHCCLP